MALTPSRWCAPDASTERLGSVKTHACGWRASELHACVWVGAKRRNWQAGRPAGRASGVS
eukprot:2763750-Rhodomonas_salina.1